MTNRFHDSWPENYPRSTDPQFQTNDRLEKLLDTVEEAAKADIREIGHQASSAVIEFNGPITTADIIDAEGPE
jgi:hypothetical protein